MGVRVDLAHAAHKPADAAICAPLLEKGRLRGGGGGLPGRSGEVWFGRVGLLGGQAVVGWGMVIGGAA